MNQQALTQTQALTGPMRLPFLLLTPACVLLGLAAAVYQTGSVRLDLAALVLVGALAAHISVNALNEYFDFRSGLDHRTRRTPFSGGSGTLPLSPSHAPHALATGLISLGITAAIGIYFVWLHGPALLPLGLAGLLLIAAYTPWLTRSPLLCLVAPGLGFGTFMAMGTAFALTGAYSWAAFAASLVPFFLVSNLLLLNQFPDVEADRTIGRYHLPIQIGRQKSSYVYAAFLSLTYLAIVAAVLLQVLPPLALLGLLTLPIALRAAQGAIRFAEQIDKLIPYLAQNVILNLVTPILVSIGLLLS